MPHPTFVQTERARVLRRLRERHAAELSARRDGLRALTGDKTEAVEDVESTVLRESRGLGAAIMSLSSRTVQLIEHALRRLQAGTYGRCADCHRSISWARLEALPFADACRDCQERREQASTFPILS